MTLGSMEPGEGRAAQLIQLEPLIHQVSGHSSLWVLDDDTVCKPLIDREAKFYRTLPPQMRAFTPEFRGTVKVLVQCTSEGVSVAALPASGQIPKVSSIPAITTATSATITTPSSRHSPPSKTTAKHVQHSNSVKARRTRSKDRRDDDMDEAGAVALPLVPQPQQTHNPWLEQCHKRYLNKLKVKTTTNVMECILLENLTHVYRVPNVLDLKMGTRQYGDDAPESKRRSQTRKAQHTTTPRLGVRLAGMQVFDRDTKCYVCKNKYVGRELTEEGFQQTLKHFLHNGRRFRIDIVDQIICKLKDLRKVVASLDSFRFFTSSLLILYDSYDAKVSHKPRDSKISERSSSKEGRVQKHQQDDHNKNRSSRDQSGSSDGRLSDSTDTNRARKKNCTGASTKKVSSGFSRESSASSSNRSSKSKSHAFSSSNKDCKNPTVSKKDENNCSTNCNNTNSNKTTNCNGDNLCDCEAYPKDESQSQHSISCRLHSGPCLATNDVRSSNTEQYKTDSDMAVDIRNVADNTKSQQTDLTSDISSQSSPKSQTKVHNTSHVASSSNQKNNGEPHVDPSNTTVASTVQINSHEDGERPPKSDCNASDDRAGVVVDCPVGTKVDIRLIDFAHATHKGMNDPTIYSGPDDGLMLGLKSLINIFSNIKELYTK